MSRLLLSVCFAVGLIACDEGRDDVSTCVIGDEAPCDCGGGRNGSRTCLPDGEYTACDCQALTTGCAHPGRLSACPCDDGASGERVCLADGTLSRCRCVVPDATPASGSDAIMSEAPAPAPAPREIVTTPLARCCSNLGTCLPQEVIPMAERDLVGRRTCDREQRCVPDAFRTPDGFALQPCRSAGQVEGRCVPDCVPAVAEVQALFPRDLCPDHHVCAPCFDPRDGVDTGICGLSNDPGPLEDPVVFGRCCQNVGECVPMALIPSDGAELLSEEGCDDSRDLVCLPDVLADEEGFVLPSCRAIPDVEGRCVPACLPQIAEQADALMQASCSDGSLCTPCFDPFSGEPTAVCSLSNDPGPAEPPFVFPSCCDVDSTPTGTCLPTSLLPPAAIDALSQETCPAPEQRCTPNSLLDDPLAGFRACSGLFGAAGGCVAECLLDPVPPLLIQSVCEQGELCVPCTSGGMPTGACFGQ